MPKPEEIRKARESAGLTQAQAAELLGLTRLSWARYEGGARKMPEYAFELFKHKAGLERIPFRSRK